jgi:hypothetical protein
MLSITSDFWYSFVLGILLLIQQNLVYYDGIPCRNEAAEAATARDLISVHVHHIWLICKYYHLVYCINAKTFKLIVGKDKYRNINRIDEVS